jgi:hypothetical protein
MGSERKLLRKLANRYSTRAGKVASALAGLGLVLVVSQLTGCASAPIDHTKYNPITGYPLVGDSTWHS